MARNHPPRALGQQQQKQPSPPASAAITAKLQLAVALHQRGQLAEAERLYLEILAQVPTDAHGLYLLGALQYQKGEHQAAVELLQKAIIEDHNYAAAYANLGLALQELKELERALAS